MVIKELLSFLQDSHIFPLVCAIIGLVILLGYLWFPLKTLFIYLKPKEDIWARYGSKDCWAIITGATDGIGLAYSHLLARKGFNVLLIARNSPKLEKRRGEILDACKENPILVGILAIDFGKPFDKQTATLLSNAIKGKEIALLVNNVGTSYTYSFEDAPFSYVQGIIYTNIHSAIFVTRTIIQAMLTRKTNKCGVIGMSSITSQNCWIYKSIYGASKSFMASFLKSLAVEYQYSPIDFLACIIGPVTTNMYPFTNFFSVSAATAAQSHLQYLGQVQETYGPWKHFLLGLLVHSPFFYFISKKAIREMKELAKARVKSANEMKTE